MAEFNEELHPRAPKGTENGGEFIKKDISDLNALNNEDINIISRSEW